MRVKNRNTSVLITGASSGFGYALAQRLDAEGWHVFAGVRTAGDATRLRTVLSSRSEPIVLDVTDAGHIEAARRTVVERTGYRLDGLVNNAGIVLHAPIESLTVEGMRRQLEVNVTGTFAVTRAFLPLIRAARGRVVVVGSISGRVAWPFNGAYAASKHALRALVESLRMEQRSFGVRVVLIEPGAFATAIWRKWTPAQYLEVDRIEPHVANRYVAAQRMVERAMAAIATRAPEPRRCVAAIHRALTATAPRARYTVGNDICLQLFFGRLPPVLKDPLMTALMKVILDRAATVPEERLHESQPAASARDMQLH